jgi:L-fucose isomerase
MRQSSYTWPHAFARMEATVDAVLGRFGSNHIHGVPGDIRAELTAVCRLLDVDVDDLEQARA